MVEVIVALVVSETVELAAYVLVNALVIAVVTMLRLDDAEIGMVVVPLMTKPPGPKLIVVLSKVTGMPPTANVVPDIIAPGPKLSTSLDKSPVAMAVVI